MDDGAHLLHDLRRGLAVGMDDMIAGMHRLVQPVEGAFTPVAVAQPGICDRKGLTHHAQSPSKNALFS